MKLVTLAGLASLVVAAATGCASKQRSGSTAWGASASAPTVTVRNDNWLDVAVYLVRGAGRFRIGTVRSTSVETFKLPADAGTGGSPLRIMADPIGSSRAYVSDPITLAPGQRLELRVASPISVSTFAVWDR